MNIIIYSGNIDFVFETFSAFSLFRVYFCCVTFLRPLLSWLPEFGEAATSIFGISFSFLWKIIQHWKFYANTLRFLNAMMLLIVRYIYFIYKYLSLYIYFYWSSCFYCRSLIAHLDEECFSGRKYFKILLQVQKKSFRTVKSFTIKSPSIWLRTLAHRANILMLIGFIQGIIGKCCITFYFWN